MSDQNKKQNYGRRNFLKYLLSAGLTGFAAITLYPLFAYLKPPKQKEVDVSNVLVGKLSELKSDEGIIVRFGNKPVIVVKTPKNELKAFSAICTHLDCTVQYRKDMGMIWCACHNGKYDLNGRNVAGPPPRPLDEYKIVIQGENVFVSKKS